MNQPIKLDLAKRCGCCGALHVYIPKSAQENESGHWWNCNCGSTLFKVKKEYQDRLELKRKRSAQ